MRLNTKDPAALTEAAAEIRQRCRREQGLPPAIEDPAALDQLAVLIDDEPLATGAAA